jgi:outer membrane protein OmpA-like peptidoglycan-associated protein
MKKIIVMLMALVTSLTLQAAISEKYEQGYDLKSLPINTKKSETNISLFGENQMLFLVGGKTYLSDFTADKEDLQTPERAKALNNLAIKGNVAYDNAKNKIYFIVEESSDSHWIYEASLKKGKWTDVRRLEIDGMGKIRGNNAFMANAGWSYLSVVKAIMINPAIAKNGNRLYFTSETIEGGEGGKDLWYIDLKDDDTWTKPVNAGKTINTVSDEDYAFIENDEILYFSSNKEGIRHLYMAEASGNAWNEAQKMPEPYNSAVNDYSIVVTNGTPYLVTDRNTGNGSDIYAFVARPCEIKLSAIEVIPEFTGTAYAIVGSVQFKDAPAKGELLIADNKGMTQKYSLPLESPFKFQIDNIDCDQDTITKVITASFTEGKCKSESSYVAPAEIKKEFYWVDFMFEFDKAELTEQSKADMERLVVEMRKFPDAKFEIAGYADARGSDAYNDALSERRAKSVKAALIEKGLKAENLTIIGKGKRFLHVRDAQTDDQHAQNRRVEVRIINTENK